MKTIMYDDWVEEYRPIKNAINKDSAYDGCMIETYGEEEESVSYSKPNTIWTLVSSDNEESWILAGYHFVNRIGFFITEKPWENEDIQVNDNEMCTTGAAKYACIEFIEDVLEIELTDEQEAKLHDYFANKF
jgi:hypothetical protein